MFKEQEKVVVVPSQDKSDLPDAESFDLNSFFADENNEESQNSPDDEVLADDTNLINSKETDLLVSLRDESDKVVRSFSTKITAEAFNKTSSFVSAAASLVNSLMGTCGPICIHGLSSLAQTSSGLSTAPGLGGFSTPGFNVDTNGNFRLDGNIDSLSSATGISKNDLLSGKFSAEDIMIAFFSEFGQGVSLIFGFGLVGGLLDSIFDSFLPTPAAA